jgi:hypothetical protein
MARCPAHEDRTASLSVTERDGCVLVHCHSGCAQADVIAALRARGLWPERKRKTFTAAERRAWARDRAALERDLPDAWLWRRAAVNMAEDLLHLLKSALFDAVAAADVGELGIGEIANVQRLLSRLSAADEITIEEYRWWRENRPGMTTAMIRAAKRREQVEYRALHAFLRHLDRAEAAAS